MVSTTTPRLTEPKSIGEPAIIALDRLTPNGSNRQIRKDEEIKGLAASIATVGLLYPIIVKPDPDQEGTYRIIAGERRFRALKRLKAEFVPCVIVNGNGNGETPNPEILRVVENHQRRNLEPLEEAAAIRALLDSDLDTPTVARSLGRSRAWVARRSSLTDLSERWVREVKNAESKISTWPPSHMETIARFPEEVQNQILDRWGDNWHRNVVPGLRELESFTSIFLHLLASAPWKQDDALLCLAAGACTACPKRSSHAPELFPEDLPGNDGRPIAGDCCLDPVCWDNKAELFLKRRVETLRREHPNLILLNAGEYTDREELQEKLGTPVVNAWDVAIGRKSDSGAIPALVVSGAGLGRLKWVVPTQDGSTTGRSSRRNAGDDNELPRERTPEEKKEPYDKRRRQFVVDAVKAKLETLANEVDLAKAADIEGGPALVSRGLVAKTLVLLHALLSEFGWRKSVHDGSAELPENLPWESLSALRNHEIGSGETRAAIHELCWGLLRLAVGKFAQRLLVAPGERTNAGQYADTETICAMLGFDLSALRSQAAQAIPYAKCWREEVADDWEKPNGGVSVETQETLASSVATA